jgi:hypothetical protein
MRLLLYVALAFIVLAVPSVNAQSANWHNATYNERMNVTVEPDNVDATLADFPVAVFLNASRIDYSKVQDSGQDLLFTNVSCSYPNSGQIPHEIERWNESGMSVVHVKVDSVSSSVNTTICLYFNDTGAADSQNVTGVWDSSFVMVQHLAEIDGDDSDSWTKDGNNPLTIAGFGDPEIWYEEDYYWVYVDNLTTGDLDIFTGSNRSELTWNCTVLTKSGSGNESSFIRDSDMVKVGSEYILYYTGDNKEFLWANSSNPGCEDSFTKQGSTGIGEGAPGAWNDEEVSEPSVIYDLAGAAGYECKMLFAGKPGVAADEDVGYAFSSDCKSFGEYAGNPVVTDGYSGASSSSGDPELSQIGSFYLMYYTDEEDTALGKAWSRDCISWNHIADNPVLDNGAGFDSAWIYAASVTHNGTTYHLCYQGSDGADQRIGCATGSIGTGIFEAFDSTSNGNDGANQQNVTNSTETMIDGTYEFDGTADYVKIADSSSLELQGDNFTLEVWVNPDALAASGYDPWLINGWQCAGAQDYSFLLALYDGGNTNRTRILVRDTGETSYFSESTTLVNVGSWYYIVGRYNESHIAMFVSGLHEDSDVANSITLKPLTNGIHLGADGCSPNYEFDGKMDEVRISDTDRSDEWIKATYYSLTDDLIYYGSEESYSAPDTDPPDVDFIAPTATNGTESANKDYIVWNISVNENIGLCNIEINGTNQTGTIVNDTADSYCYYNETSISGNVTRCAWGYGADTEGNLNMTLDYVCRDTNEQQDLSPPNVDFISPTATNGTEAINKTYILWNISVSENIGFGRIEINGTNQTCTTVNDTTNSYCYYNETGLPVGNRTRCALGHATDEFGNWNNTVDYVCRSVAVYPCGNWYALMIDQLLNPENAVDCNHSTYATFTRSWGEASVYHELHYWIEWTYTTLIFYINTHGGSGNMLVEVWNGSSWIQVESISLAGSPTNYSIRVPNASDYVNASNHIRFRSRWTGGGGGDDAYFTEVFNESQYPACPDGECNGDENCASCPADCGTCIQVEACNSSTVGQTTCGGARGSYSLVCRRYAYDVYQWDTENMTYCDDYCWNGTCQYYDDKHCKDRCQEGDMTCIGQYAYTCNNVTANNCTDWNKTSATFCEFGCYLGVCINQTSKCSLGQAICEGDWIVWCDDDNSDGYLEWSEYNRTRCEFSCHYNETTESGSCSQTPDESIFEIRKAMTFQQMAINFIFGTLRLQVIFGLIAVIGVMYFIGRAAGWRVGFYGGIGVLLLLGIWIPSFLFISIITIIIMGAWMIYGKSKGEELDED